MSLGFCPRVPSGKIDKMVVTAYSGKQYLKKGRRTYQQNTENNKNNNTNLMA